MEVVTIESQAFKRLVFLVEETFKNTQALANEVKQLKPDRWMTPEEVCEYTGFKYTWLYARKNKIGCFKEGKALRFRKSNVDRYMEALSYREK